MDLEIVIVSGCVVLNAMWLVYWYRCYKKIDEQNSFIVGTLRVDCSDEDGPYMFLELGVPIEEIINKERVILIVNTKSYISRK